MENPFACKSQYSLGSIFCGLVFSVGILLVICNGCGKEEKVAEKSEEFKEVIQSAPESLVAKAVGESKQTVPGQTEVGKTPQSAQPAVVKPVTAQDLYNKGLECFNQGQLAEAVELFNKATDMDNTIVEAFKKKASAYSKLGMTNEAIASFKKVVELNPNDAEARLALGTFYVKKHKDDDALLVFEKYVSLYPNTNNASVYYNVGCLYDRKGLADKAIAAYKHALKLNPNYFDAYYNLSVTYNRAGLYNDAVATCEKLLELNPGNANAHFLLGDTYGKLGKSKEAQEEYDIYKKLIFVK